MAYIREIKEHAFTLYAQGFSYEEIAKRMRVKFKKLCPRLKDATVSKWANRGEWELRSERVRKEIETQTEQKVVSDRLRVIGKLKLIRDDLLGKIVRMKPKSFEGAWYVVNGVLKRLDVLEGNNGKGKDMHKVVMVIFNVLADDPRIGPELKEREPFLLKQIEAKLNRESGEDRIDEVDAAR